MFNFNYFPIIKTRDAELKCMSKLDWDVCNSVLPIYELTKSRKTTKAPDGDIHRRMNTIADIQKGRPFILDVCTWETYVNPQIEQLFDETDGYHYWRYFLGLYKELNIIPMVHLYDDQEFSEVEKFVSTASREYEYLALRLPYDLEDIKKYVEIVLSSLNKKCKLLVVLDADFIQADPVYGIEDIVENFITSCCEIEGLAGVTAVITAATSFPKSVAKYGDSQGIFDILEEKVFRDVSQQCSAKFGDYASINTEQVEIKGGSFIPRIDIALDEEFIYTRHRRDDGSYPLCAQRMVLDSRYKSIDSWADGEILSASEGTPNGISPSYWIAVRMNYYITSRALLRDNGM